MDNNNLYSMIRLLILIFIFSNTAHAADKWDRESLLLASVFTTATIIDWGQTRDIVKNSEKIYPDGYHEKTNIFLSRNPTMQEVDTYMPIAILTMGVISHLLPDDSRKKLLYGATFLEVGTIYNNYKIGLTINF
jgi:hypothetical protein